MGILREPDFFRLVKKNIEKIRDQGEPPRSDLVSLDSMDKYVCDLCKASTQRSGLIQCSFCGRWVCREGCFDRDDVSCLNCHGIIKLLRESQDMNIRAKRKSVLLDERKRVLREELRYQTKRDEIERKRKYQEIEDEGKKDKLERKRKYQEIEFENEQRKTEQKRRLKDIKSDKESPDPEKGLLHAIKKMKRMKDSENAKN